MSGQDEIPTIGPSDAVSTIGAAILNGLPAWHVFPTFGAVQQLAQEIEQRRQGLLRQGVSEERIQRWLDQAHDVYTTTAESPRDALDRFYVDLLREELGRPPAPTKGLQAAVEGMRQAAGNVYATEDPALLARMKAAREDAGRKALDALGRYKFERFGYWAAAWVQINRLLPARARARSPFKHVVKAANADPAYVLEVLAVTDRDPATRRR